MNKVQPFIYNWSSPWCLSFDFKIYNISSVSFGWFWSVCHDTGSFNLKKQKLRLFRLDLESSHQLGVILLILLLSLAKLKILSDTFFTLIELDHEECGSICDPNFWSKIIAITYTRHCNLWKVRRHWRKQYGFVNTFSRTSWLDAQDK